MRRRWINRGPRPCFSGCLCAPWPEGAWGTIYSSAHTARFLFRPSPHRLRECIWRACLGAVGMLRNGERAGAEEMGSYHSCSKISAAFGLPIPVVLAAFTQHNLRYGHFSTVSGGSWCRVTWWRERRSWGGGQPDLASAPTSSLGLALHACRMGTACFLVLWMIWDHVCWIPGIWKAFKKYQSPPYSSTPALREDLWYDSQLNTQSESVAECALLLHGSVIYLTPLLFWLQWSCPRSSHSWFHHLSLSSNFKTLSWPD